MLGAGVGGGNSIAVIIVIAVGAEAEDLLFFPGVFSELMICDGLLGLVQEVIDCALKFQYGPVVFQFSNLLVGIA